MDKTVNVKENIMDELKPVFGDVPVPKGAIEAQVKRLWINQFGEVEPELLRQTSQAAQYEFERFPTRKQYHELLVKIASMQPQKAKQKTDYDLWLEEVNNRQEQTKMWLMKFEPELHESIFDRAVDYYVNNNLCVAPEQVRTHGRVQFSLPPVDANEKLRKILSIPVEDRNVFQQTVIKLLKSTVIEHIQQAGHMQRFEKEIGL